LSSCREHATEPEGGQQLPRLIKGFCGILFDGGFSIRQIHPALRISGPELRELDTLLHSRVRVRGCLPQ
jgi:hypothetical protein